MQSWNTLTLLLKTLTLTTKRNSDADDDPWVCRVTWLSGPTHGLKEMSWSIYVGVERVGHLTRRYLVGVRRGEGSAERRGEALVVQTRKHAGRAAREVLYVKLR